MQKSQKTIQQENRGKKSGLGIHSFPHSVFALSLKIAHFKERP